jgi:hypothetical protein
MDHWILIFFFYTFAHNESTFGPSKYSWVSYICVPAKASPSICLLISHSYNTIQETSVTLQQYRLAANISIIYIQNGLIS